MQRSALIMRFDSALAHCAWAPAAVLPCALACNSAVVIKDTLLAQGALRDHSFSHLPSILGGGGGRIMPRAESSRAAGLLATSCTPLWFRTLVSLPSGGHLASHASCRAANPCRPGACALLGSRLASLPSGDGHPIPGAEAAAPAAAPVAAASVAPPAGRLSAAHPPNGGPQTARLPSAGQRHAGPQG